MLIASLSYVGAIANPITSNEGCACHLAEVTLAKALAETLRINRD
jgi:hypothetical protein